MSKLKPGHNNDSFRLLKDTDNLKKGRVFSSFGGLVFGVVAKINGKEEAISFQDKNWFKLVERRKFVIDENFFPLTEKNINYGKQQIKRRFN